MKQFKNVKRNLEKELERRGSDLNRILNPEYIKKNAFLSLQKYSNSEDGILVKRFLNLQVVPRIYVRDDSFGENEVVSAKISEQFLVQAGIDSVDFFAWAERNILKHAYIKSLDQILFEMCEADDDIDMEVHSPFYVASAGNYGGASVLLCSPVLKAFCDKHNVETCTILPSSREEILLIPDGIYSFNPIELVELVNEANCNVVDPILQLDPVVYRFNRNDNLVTIIAKK